MMKLGALSHSPILPKSKKDHTAKARDLSELMRRDERLGQLIEIDTPLFDFLTAAMSLSPHLCGLINARPDDLVATLEGDLDQQMQHIIDCATHAWISQDGALRGEADLMEHLRNAKRRASLCLGLYDLAQVAVPQTITGFLSALASACLSSTINHLLRNLHAQGTLSLPDPDRPAKGSGLFVLGMGKLGAGELNYSSDVDLIVFFDRKDAIPLTSDATEIYAKLVRKMVHIMQHFTKDGYVFRTDLRLRPDPGSTPLAFPVEAALNYYEGRGQNWERAAYIKAKIVAGDEAAGAVFLQNMQPFIYRKYLDYAAISDIHSIKRQIHAHRDLGDISVKGHNVKLGRGGIREIEFFVQTQQLIAGGRNPNLRVARTDDALIKLEQAGWITGEDAQQLDHSYWFLRNVEHRIQMVSDQQSHQLPDNKDDLKLIARMMGFKTVNAFSKIYIKHLKGVVKAYAHLFDQEEQLSIRAGNLSFTGEDDDQNTMETLSQIGFKRPSDIVRVVRNWHRGRYRATRTTKARERLTELTPKLLEAFGQADDPDEALIKFDHFLSGLPAGIQLFSLLGNNSGLLSLLQTIMTAAPRMRDMIAKRAHIFDGLLDPGILSQLPTSSYLEDRLQHFLKGAIHYEETLDRLRIFSAEQKFLIGVRLLTGAIDGARAGLALSDLADLMIKKALDAVTAQMVEKHGHIKGGQVAIIGMGKLASREMSAGSDVDIILIYDCDDAGDESDGPKPLDVPRYYTRLTQRLVAALSAPTAEGILYDVDLRLRPSGNKGPVATSLKAFSKYQRHEAWVWEHMALSRARCVAGDEALMQAVQNDIYDVLARPRDHSELVREIRKMRRLLDQEKPPENEWDFKLIPGGLVDIEFIVQYLSLRERAGGWLPEKAETTTSYLLTALCNPHLTSEQSQTLNEALALWTSLSQMTRLCMESSFEPAQMPKAFQDLLLDITHLPDANLLRFEMTRLSKTVRQIFHDVLGSGPIH